MLKDVPNHLLTPMIKHQGVIYYVNELVQCKCGACFIPNWWIMKNGSMYAVGYFVTECKDGLNVETDHLETVEVSTFSANIETILSSNTGIYPFSEGSRSYWDMMPHPLWKVTGSRMVYSIPLVIFQDDVSGNQSKQWNKHYSCYLSNGMIPHQKLESEFHVCFVATSLFASPLEIMQGIQCSIEVGGSQKYKQSDEGFLELLKNNPECAAYTPDKVQSILTDELKWAQGLGHGILNLLIDMDGVDIHKDTLTEILHTILLGIVKYYWGQTMWILEKAKQLEIFQAWLNSVVTDGLNVPKLQADYMCQYKGGLIGKHFKTISQVMAFAVYDIVLKEVLEAWLIIRQLTVLLWHMEIKDIESYMASLGVCYVVGSISQVNLQKELDLCINDFLNITSLLFSTECYEAYNAVFHAASVFRIDCVKHIVTGGWWLDIQMKQWTRASQKVLAHILEHPKHASMVGLPMKQPYSPGVTLEHLRATRINNLLWDSLRACKVISKPAAFNSFECRCAVIASSGEVLKCGGNAIIRVEGGDFLPLSFGIIHEITVARSKMQPIQDLAYITVQCFDLAAMKHPLLDMPSVSLSQRYVVIHPQDIISAVDLQHDCHRGACSATGTQAVYEEREITSLSRTVVTHTDSEHYIVNIASLHNYAQIASVLPSNLQTPSFHIKSEATLGNGATLQIQLAKQKPPPGTAEPDPTLSLNAMEAPLTAAENNSTTIPSYGDDQPTPNQEGEAPPLAPLFLHHPKEKPQKGKAKQSTQAIESCTVDVLKYFCDLYGLSKAGKKADLVDRLMKDIQSLQHTYPAVQEISMAQDAVKQLTEVLATSHKRKRVEPEVGTNSINNSEGLVKKKKGTVEDDSCRENEGMLRGLFTNT
ncbi:hypothetical protein BJV74DRAFT_799157 [Russula compacta]|nr:hypothetical protein BJV74DRAFT_799157 [Russula compacta]